MVFMFSNLPLQVICRPRAFHSSLSPFSRHLRSSVALFSQSHSSSCISTSSDDRSLLKPHIRPESLILRIRSSLIRCGKHSLLPFKALIIVHGLIGDENLIGEFVRRCFDHGDTKLALSNFECFLVRPTLSLQNLIIRRLSGLELYEQVLSVYCRCVLTGCSSDCYTFPFVFKACSALRCVGLGKQVHGVVLRTGFERNVVVQTSLLDFYARIGQVKIARNVFDGITEPDIVSWNALISGFSLNGLFHEAFSSLRKIWINGLKPNVSTLASIIPICSRTGCLQLGKTLHGYAVKSGIDFDQLLIPAFISVYANNGDMPTARSLFDLSPTRSEIVWNSMIHSHTVNMESYEGYKTFRDMLRAELQPNAASFVSVIPGCENHSSIWAGECLHACVIKYGFETHAPVATALMSMYAKHRRVHSAEILFDSVYEKNTLTFNSMVSGYLYNELWGAALRIACDMLAAGFTPDAVSLISVLSACSKLKEFRHGQSVHAFGIRKGLDAELNLSNSLLAFYSSCNQLSFSFRIFQRMKIRDSVSWNTLLSGCVYNQEPENVLVLLWQMQQEGVKLDSVTLISALASFKEPDDLKHGMCLQCYSIKSGFVADVSLGNALISMYANCGDLGAAFSWFDLMPEKDVVSWNALITGYRYSYLQNEAHALLRRMMETGQKPNYVTLLNLLPLCCSLLQGKSIHAYAVRTQLISQVPLVTSLITMYARFESIKPCFSLYETGDKSNISLWNAMISVLVQASDVQRAVAFFHKLLLTKLAADHVTILSLIIAYAQSENTNSSKSFLSYVTKSGFLKDTTISNALIDLFAKCGDISISRQIFELLSHRDSVTWSTMINGHGLNGDGNAAFDLFLKMKDSGLKPDSVTCLSVLSACSHSGLVQHSIKAFNLMLEEGMTLTMEHCGCIMDLLGRTGHLNEAYSLLKKMMPFEASGSILETLLGACGVHGNLEIGAKVGEEMVERNAMNAGACVMLHNLYAGAGKWEDANRVRMYMDDKHLRKPPGFSQA